MDVYFKWMDVYIMRSIILAVNIAKLREIFAIYGFLEIIVSDNCFNFISVEFEKYIKVSLYYLVLNG